MSSFTPASRFDRSTWIELMERSPERSLELHPELVGLSQQAALPPLVYADRKGGALHTLGVLDGKAMSALSPPQLSWLGRLQGYRLAGHELAGALDRESADRFVSAVIDQLGGQLGDFVFFEDIDVGTPLWDAVMARRAEPRVIFDVPHAPQPHWRIRFPKKPADYWSSMSRKSRYNSRRAARQFEHEIERYTAPEQIADFLARAEHISERSWQGRRLGIRMKRDARHQARLGAIAALGALRCYVLTHQQAPVAFVFGWQWNGRYEYEEIGYDSAFIEQSPGRVLLFRILEDLIADDCPRVLDFGCGDAVYKRIFGNDEGESGALLLAANHLRGKLWANIRWARKRVDQDARALLRRAGLYEHARRLYRRVGSGSADAGADDSPSGD
ncbi:MAG: hypothetical protein Tsb0020_44320 [Haliangiales bacterium]